MSLRPMRSLESILTTILLGTLVACGGDDSTGLDLGGGPVTAKVDGVAWTAVTAYATNVGGFIAVGASNAVGEAIGFALQGSAVGTYTFGVSDPATASLTISSDVWAAGGGTGSGSIIITALDGTHVAGTFAFEGVSATGTPANRSITEGVFDVDF